MPVPPERQPDWAAYRGKIEDLYWNHAKELPEVMNTMKAVYGFVATYASSSLLPPPITGPRVSSADAP
jgi:hypothetical protein